MKCLGGCWELRDIAFKDREKKAQATVIFSQ